MQRLVLLTNTVVGKIAKIHTLQEFRYLRIQGLLNLYLFHRIPQNLKTT